MTAPWLVSPPTQDLDDLAFPAGVLQNNGTAPAQSTPTVGIRETGTTRNATGADANNAIYFNNAGAITYTVLADFWPNAVALVNDGAGTLTVAQGAGVTVNTNSNVVATSALLLPGPTAGSWYLVNNTADPGGELDEEAVQDIIGAMVSAAGGAYNDAAGTLIFPGGNIGFAAPVNFSSATPSDIWATGSLINTMSGNSTITTFGTPAAGVPILHIVRCTGSPVLTHSAALDCPNSMDLRLHPEDVFVVANVGSSNAVIVGVFSQQPGPARVTYAQFAALSPVDRQEVIITDLTGCPFPGLHLIYDGTNNKWQPVGEQVYFETHTPILIATASAVEQLITSVLLKAGIPYKNAMKTEVLWYKDGTTDAVTNLRIRINTAANLSGNSLYADSTGMIAANQSKGSTIITSWPDTTNVIREGVPGNNMPYEPTASATAPRASVTGGGNISTTDHYLNFAATGTSVNKQGIANIRVTLLPSN